MKPHFHFASPRKLPKPDALKGRVVVLDLAFAADGIGRGFKKTTGAFITSLGERLACWVDHHDHPRHKYFAQDDRFILSTKAQHGGCPEMINVELVERIGPVDTILSHFDLDGIYSAVKWALGGIEPYPGADADARAVDTRIGDMSPTAAWIDAALRADWDSDRLRMAVVDTLLASAGKGVDRSLVSSLCIDQSARRFESIMQNTKVLADRFDREGGVVVVTVPPGTEDYDKTELLLLGQKLAPVSVVVDRGTATMAANFDSGLNFLHILNIGGGMPTRVSVPAKRLPDAVVGINKKLEELGLI